MKLRLSQDPGLPFHDKSLQVCPPGKGRGRSAEGASRIVFWILGEDPLHGLVFGRLFILRELEN